MKTKKKLFTWISSEKIKVLVFVLLFFVALIPRSIELFSNSRYFGSEEGALYLITKKIVVDHEVVLVAFQGGPGEILKPAGFNYLLAVPFIIASGNPFGGRVFMFIISVLTIIIAIVVTNRMFGFQTSFFISFLLAISPSLSHYAGMIHTPSLVPLLTILLLFFFFKVLHGDKKFIFLIAFVIGLTSHFEMATAGTLAIQFFILTVVLLIKRTVSFRHVVLALGFFILTLLPIFIYDFQHDFYNIKGVVKMIDAGKRQTINLAIHNKHTLLENRLDTFRWNFISTFTPHRMVGPALLVIMCLGAFIYIRDNKISLSNRLFMSYLATSPFFIFLILLFYPENIVAWWLIELAVFYCFLLGIIAAYFWQKPLFKLFVLLFFLALFKAFIWRTFLLYKNEFTHFSSLYILEAKPIAYIYQDANGRPFSLVVFPTRPHQENYEYLIWWYGTKYGIYPDKQNKDILYTIIEGNYDHLDNKLLSIEKIRELVYTKEFDNGFNVQKWMIKKL